MALLYICHHVAWWWSGTFPAFFSFHSFKTCRSDILIGVLFGFEVFLPVLSLTSFMDGCSLISLWTSMGVLCVEPVTVIWRVLSSPSLLQGEGFLNSLTSFLCPLVHQGFNTLHFDNLCHLHWVDSTDPGHYSFLDHLVHSMCLALHKSTFYVFESPGQDPEFIY